ncbi:hypothetical protein KA119_02365 [Candidatus Gracilibacteria bacterium]|nr:hypothetical protein [Candidatus Gracilibacteria bacterium]
MNAEEIPAGVTYVPGCPDSENRFLPELERALMELMSNIPDGKSTEVNCTAFGESGDLSLICKTGTPSGQAIAGDCITSFPETGSDIDECGEPTKVSPDYPIEIICEK